MLRNFIVPCGFFFLLVFLSLFLFGHYPLIFIGIGTLLVSWLIGCAIKTAHNFRKKGYRAGHQGRDNIFYMERVGDNTRELVIYGEMLIDAPHAIYVPGDVRWKREMPEWAKDRKSEILNRIKEELGTKNHKFVEH